MSARRRLPIGQLALLLPIVLSFLSPSQPAVRPGRQLRSPSDARQTSTVQLAVGEALHAAVERQGAESTVSLIDPAGREVYSLDSPDWIDGREDLFAVAEKAGDYQLAIERRGVGSVHVEIDLPHPATARDRLRAAAVREQSLGDGLRHLGKIEEAVAAYQRSIAAWRRAAAPKSVALARYRLAAALEDISSPTGTPTVEALEIDRALLAAWGRSFEGDGALNAVGRCYAKLHLAVSASDAFRRAELQARKLGDRVGRAEARVELAQLDREVDLQAALDQLDEARNEFRALGLREREARPLLLTGQIHYMLGAWEEAIDAAMEGRELARDGRYEVGFLQLLAATYAGQRLWPQAAESFERLRVLARKRRDRTYETSAVAGLGYAYLKQEQTERALGVLAADPKLARCNATSPTEANVLGNLGAVYSKLGRSAEAFRCFDRATEIYRLSNMPAEETLVLFGKAEALERVGHLPEALEMVDEAIDKVERLRTEVAGSDLRSSFFARQQESYELAVHILMNLDAKAPGRGFDRRAFDIAERMRARSLLDELGAARLDVHARAPRSLRDQENAIQDRLARLGEVLRRVGKAKGPRDQPNRIAAELRRANSELETVRGRMRSRDALYRSIAHPTPLGLREIQRRVLDGETLLLAYSLGDEESFLWVVGSSSLHVHRLDGRQKIEQLAGAASICFAARDGCSDRDREKTSAQLSNAILRPAAVELAGRRLLVAADGALQHIPFTALPDPETPAGTPLIQAHEIVYLTSASLLPTLRHAHEHQPSKLVAALGDAVFERDDPRLSGALQGGGPSTRDDAQKAAQDLGLDRLPRLEHTREEVEKIVSLAPPKLTLKATDFEASRARVMSSELGSYRYVHLATHALLDANNPELTGIVLSRYDAQGRKQKGFIHAYEVYGLKLSADLVVLSACRTGLGNEVRGEGTIGLTRGFMYAGAPRVVVSLWDVDDRSTAELMQEFYRGMIRDHLRPAAALRRAQIAILKKYHSPYDWAAFQLQGDWR